MAATGARRAGFSPAELALIGTAAAIVFTRVFAFSLTTLGFTEYVKRDLIPAGTATATANLLAGIAFGAYGVTMALAQLATGVLSDRVGRRPVLLAGTALFVAGAAASALAQSVWPLVVAQLVQGLGGVSSTALAAVGETVPPDRRTTAMAMVGVPAGVAAFLGFVVGPALTGTPTDPGVLPFAGLFWLSAVLGAMAIVPILLRPLPAPIPGLAQPRHSLTPAVLSLAAAGFAVNFALRAAMYDFGADVLAVIGTLVFAGMLASAFVIMGLVSRRIDKGASPWLAIAAALVALGAAAPLFRLSATVGIVVAAGIVFFAAHSILSAVLPSQVSRLAGRSGGAGHGIQLVVAYLGTAAGGFAAGLFDAQPLDTFVVLGGVALVAAALVIANLRSPVVAAPRPEEPA